MILCLHQCNYIVRQYLTNILDYVIMQGSEENPGLAVMAISEILPIVEELGGLLTISCYEICQDRVYDLLEPKEHEVFIMEDAKRKIHLKGLSQVFWELMCFRSFIYWRFVS